MALTGKIDEDVFVAESLIARKEQEIALLRDQRSKSLAGQLERCKIELRQINQKLNEAHDVLQQRDNDIHCLNKKLERSYEIIEKKKVKINESLNLLKEAQILAEKRESLLVSAICTIRSNLENIKRRYEKGWNAILKEIEDERKQRSQRLYEREQTAQDEIVKERSTFLNRIKQLEQEATFREDVMKNQRVKLEHLYSECKNALDVSNYERSLLQSRVSELTQQVQDKAMFTQKCEEDIKQIHSFNEKRINLLKNNNIALRRENDRNKRKLETLLFSIERMEQYPMDQSDGKLLSYSNNQNHQLLIQLKKSNESILSYQSCVKRLNMEIRSLQDQVVEHKRQGCISESARTEAKEELAQIETERVHLISQIDRLVVSDLRQKNEQAQEDVKAFETKTISDAYELQKSPTENSYFRAKLLAFEEVKYDSTGGNRENLSDENDVFAAVNTHDDKNDEKVLLREENKYLQDMIQKMRIEMESLVTSKISISRNDYDPTNGPNIMQLKMRGVDLPKNRNLKAENPSLQDDNGTPKAYRDISDISCISFQRHQDSEYSALKTKVKDLSEELATVILDRDRLQDISNKLQVKLAKYIGGRTGLSEGCYHSENISPVQLCFDATSLRKNEVNRDKKQQSTKDNNVFRNRRQPRVRNWNEQGR